MLVDENECICALLIKFLAQMYAYFLVMNRKRCRVVPVLHDCKVHVKAYSDVDQRTRVSRVTFHDIMIFPPKTEGARKDRNNRVPRLLETVSNRRKTDGDEPRVCRNKLRKYA